MLADEVDPLEPAPETPEPQLVVVYRSRGVPWLLVPPLLILAAVVAIVGYRRSIGPVSSQPVPPGSETFVTGNTNPPVSATVLDPDPKGLTEPDVSARPTIPYEPAPVTARLDEPVPGSRTAEPVSTNEVAVVNPPAPPPEPPPAPIEPVKRDPVGFDPDAAKLTFDAAPGPEDSSRPQTADVLADIRREAEQKQADRQALEAMKPDLLNLDPREVARRKVDLIKMARRQAANDRSPFHADLTRLLAEQGNGAGPEIQALCNRYGRETLPEILNALNRDLVGPASRLSPPARVKRMRLWGVPETIIMDDLVEEEMRNRKSRGGPRTVGEAWVRAARVLLSFPPIAPAPASVTSTPGARIADAPTGR